MTISECEVKFHELSRHSTTILHTEEERVPCFMCGLRFQLRIETEPVVSTGRSFIDVIDHARTIEHIPSRGPSGSLADVFRRHCML